MTRLRMKSTFEIANFAACDNKKQPKLCYTCVNYDESLGVCTFVRNISITLQITDIFEKL